MSKNEKIETQTKINKEIIIKNYLKYSEDKGILVQVLNAQNKDEFSEEEIIKLLQKEKERVIK